MKQHSPEALGEHKPPLRCFVPYFTAALSGSSRQPLTLHCSHQTNYGIANPWNKQRILYKSQIQIMTRIITNIQPAVPSATYHRSKLH